MNIYEKIQSMKSELQKMNLRKSGENKFAKFKYYELSDFLPALVELGASYKICTYIDFSNELSTLTAVNAENPEEKFSITSPMRELDLKGCNAIQALGGIQTYQRRYLYMAMFDIVENDMFDSIEPQTAKKSAPPSPTREPDKLDELQYNFAIKRGDVICESIVNAATATAAIPELKKIQHVGNSATIVGRKINARVKELGLVFDKDAACYVVGGE